MRHHLRFNIIVETENKNVLSEGARARRREYYKANPHRHEEGQRARSGGVCAHTWYVINSSSKLKLLVVFSHGMHTDYKSG